MLKLVRINEMNISDSMKLKLIQKPKLQDNELIDITKSKDIVTGKYEGGLKVWECSLDLSTFICENISLFSTNNGINNKILELGCGYGIPGLILLKNGYSVDFQDLNKDVLINCTTPNILLNVNNSELINTVRLISGSWENMKSSINYQYDIIITSETVYTEYAIETLYNLLKIVMKESGICVLSGKKYYFGLGGGTQALKDYNEKNKSFVIDTLRVFDDGASTIREILVLKFNK